MIKLTLDQINYSARSDFLYTGASIWCNPFRFPHLNLNNRPGDDLAIPGPRGITFMNEESDDDFFNRKFNVTKIEKTDPPAGMQAGEWYRYVIGKGSSEIQGIRPGTLQSVTEHAEEYASNLNQRATQGYTAYTAAKRTKPAPDSSKSDDNKNNSGQTTV